MTKSRVSYVKVVLALLFHLKVLLHLYNLEPILSPFSFSLIKLSSSSLLLLLFWKSSMNELNYYFGIVVIGGKEEYIKVVFVFLN